MSRWVRLVRYCANSLSAVCQQSARSLPVVCQKAGYQSASSLSAVIQLYNSSDIEFHC